MPETEEIEDFVSKEKGVTHIDKLMNEFKPENEQELLKRIKESSKLALTNLDLVETTEKIVSDKELQEIVEMGESKILTSKGPGISKQAETLLNAAEQIKEKGKVSLVKDKSALNELAEKELLEERKGYFFPTKNFHPSVKALKKTLKETEREELIQ